MNTITATATRSGDWWAVEFTGPTGQRFTQARRLDQIDEMVRDLCDLDGVSVDQVDVVATGSPEQQKLIEAYRTKAAAARRANEEAASGSRIAVRSLRQAGLPVRDVAVLMGISPQRVSQLTH